MDAPCDRAPWRYGPSSLQSLPDQAMPAALPHYLLFSEASHESSARAASLDGGLGRWKFVLEAVDGSAKFEASDDEHDLSRERLELLVVVRGLEALPHPSRVTMITTSRYVCRGLRFGLAEWRENDWHWEHFGHMLPVKNADLWQRLDRALGIHEVQCRTLRIDAPHVRQRAANLAPPVDGRELRPAGPGLVRDCAQRAGQWMRGRLGGSRVPAAQLL